VFISEGIEVKKSALQVLKMNVYAERFLLTTRTGCTDRMLIFGHRHLRTILHPYTWHYKHRQTHRALNLRAPADDTNVIPFQVRTRDGFGNPTGFDLHRAPPHTG
jgi:hypothetical protein